jgi:hypothetical protein
MILIHEFPFEEPRYWKSFTMLLKSAPGAGPVEHCSVISIQLYYHMLLSLVPVYGSLTNCAFGAPGPDK